MTNKILISFDDFTSKTSTVSMQLGFRNVNFSSTVLNHFVMSVNQYKYCGFIS